MFDWKERHAGPISGAVEVENDLQLKPEERTLTMKHHLKGQALAAGLGALLLTGSTLAAHAAVAQSEPSVLVMSQKISDGHVVLDYANLPATGYAVVYGADKDGNPIKEPLGSIELNAGNHIGVKIKLNETPPKGSQLWVSLYTYKDGKTGLDRKGDTAVWSDRIPLENRITIQ